MFYLPKTWNRLANICLLLMWWNVYIVVGILRVLIYYLKEWNIRIVYHITLCTINFEIFLNFLIFLPDDTLSFYECHYPPCCKMETEVSLISWLVDHQTYSPVSSYWKCYNWIFLPSLLAFLSLWWLVDLVDKFIIFFIFYFYITLLPLFELSVPLRP